MIGFIGAGNMATALVSSISGKRIVSDTRKKSLQKIKKLGVQVTSDNLEVVQKSSVIFLCVKPQDMDSVLKEIGSLGKGKLFVSIAAGVTLGKIQSLLKGAKVVRVMPNTPALVGEMAAGYALGKGVSRKEAALVDRLLNAAGMAVKVKESQLDAVTGLSGSGPAFFAYLFDAFITAGKKQGLSQEIATQLTLQTAFGTARLLGETGMSATELITKVSSKKGTTVAGRSVLEKSNIQSIISKTIAQATKRSKQLRN